VRRHILPLFATLSWEQLNGPAGVAKARLLVKKSSAPLR